MLCLVKMSRDLHTLFAAMMHLGEGLSFETLLMLRVERSLIRLVGTQRPTVSILELPIFVLENTNKKYIIKILPLLNKAF
jgi:hypothetical protein